MPETAIVAGPLYIDFVTAETSPLAGDFHTILRPYGKRNWADQAEVGGSAWRVALELAKKGIRVVFTSRIATVPAPSAHASAHCVSPFATDSTWLRGQIEAQTGKLGCPLELQLKPASKLATNDLTFHLFQPEPLMWPIFTLAGGASQEVSWGDVVSIWKDLLPRIDPSRTMIFLAGVLRTNLFQTLTKALENNCATTAQILNEAKVVFDLGRTDLRGEGSDKDDEVKRIRGCIRQAHIVMVDYSTATALRLLNPDNLPRDYLVVRPQGVFPGPWWLYRRHPLDPENSGPTGQLERLAFTMPPPPESPVPGTVSGRRPRDAAEVARRLTDQLLRRSSTCVLPGATDWEPVLDTFDCHSPEDLTRDPTLLKDLSMLRRRVVADHRFSVLLIYGETGIGKSVIARWLHRIHPRRQKGPFIQVDCGRMEGELVESVIFGHVKGAFTGATKDRAGAFLAANGGFLLLDDLDNLPLSTQAKLLSVIETGQVHQVGADKGCHTSVFLVVTTNARPAELVRDDKLRPDLFYRLFSAGYLELPPLRKRRPDAIRIAKCCWGLRNDSLGTTFLWPRLLHRWVKTSQLFGNCREIDGVIERAHAILRSRNMPLATDALVPADDLREEDLALALKPIEEVSGVLAGKSKAKSLRHTYYSCSSGQTGPFDCNDGPATLTLPPVGPGKSDGTPGLNSNTAQKYSLDQWLGERGYPRECPDWEDLDERLDRFLHLWAECCSQNVDCNSVLSRQTIMRCMGVSEDRDRAMKAILNKSSHSMQKPRVTPVGAGRGAKWRLVFDRP